MKKNIVIVGGTHGNEGSGITLIRQWKQANVQTSYPSLNLDFVIANQAAIDENVRFIDEDLNRQFTFDRLKNNNPAKEAKLATTLNATLGPKGQSETDLVVDIHNTTSNMGATLIVLETDEFNVQLSRYVKQVMPEAVVLVEDEKPFLEHGYLCTTGKRGIMIEVGAQPQGVVREDIYRLVEKMAHAILAFCEQYRAGEPLITSPCEAFRLGETVNFPLDKDGKRTAMIHRSLQDSDFKPLAPGEPVFTGFDGQTIGWWGNQTTYPHFINEAAYHKLDVAFATADKFEL